jgi:hypothetical protein
MRTAFLGDLRTVQPETIPDLDVSVRREEELATVDHRIARAVSLLLGGSTVVTTNLSKNRTGRQGRSKDQRNKHPDFHVGFPRSRLSSVGYPTMLMRLWQ